MNGMHQYGKDGDRSFNTKWMACISIAKGVTGVSTQNEWHASVWQRVTEVSTQMVCISMAIGVTEVPTQMNGMHQYGNRSDRSHNTNEWYASVWQRVTEVSTQINGMHQYGNRGDRSLNKN